MGYVELSCRWLLGLVFAVAVVSKARDPRGFTASVRRMAPLPERLPELLPAGLSALLPGGLSARLSQWRLSGWLLSARAGRRLYRALAVLVAGLETALVVLLALPSSTAVTCGFALALGLDGAFAWAVLGALRRGERAPCHCFGVSEQPLGARQLVRDLVLVGLSALGLLAQLSPGGGTHPAGWALAGCAGAVGALLLILLDDLVGLFLPLNRPAA
jgi:hypothetical protein